MTEGRQAGAGADRPDDEARAAVGCYLGDRVSGQLGCAPVDLERLLGQLELAKRHRRAAEAVGLDRIGTRLEIAEMNLEDQVRPAQVQDLGAVLLAPEVALDREIPTLDLGPHGAVEQEDALLERLQKVRHRDPPQAACARPGQRPSSRQAAIVSSARLRV